MFHFNGALTVDNFKEFDAYWSSIIDLYKCQTYEYYGQLCCENGIEFTKNRITTDAHDYTNRVRIEKKVEIERSKRR